MEGSKGPAKLSCKHNGAELYVVTNNTFKNHKRDKLDEVEAATHDSGGKQRPLRQTVPFVTVTKAARGKLAMFFFSSSSPIRHIENDNLDKAKFFVIRCEKCLP
jgi:hypothetical protein